MATKIRVTGIRQVPDGEGGGTVFIAFDLIDADTGTRIDGDVQQYDLAAADTNFKNDAARLARLKADTIAWAKRAEMAEAAAKTGKLAKLVGMEWDVE